MTSTGDNQRGPSALDRALAHETTLPVVVYALFLAGLFTGGLASLVGVILAYVQLPKVAGSYLATHYRYQIRTFWIGLLYLAIAAVLMVIGIGFLLAAAALVWWAVRCILGLNRLGKHQPIADPATWLW